MPVKKSECGKLSRPAAKSSNKKCVRKRKNPTHPKMKAQQAKMAKAFKAVRDEKKAGEKTDSKKVMKNPEDAAKNPRKYIMK